MSLSIIALHNSSALALGSADKFDQDFNRAAKNAKAEATRNCCQPQSIGMLIGDVVPGGLKLILDRPYINVEPSGNPRATPPNPNANPWIIKIFRMS
jgi:hypothetical protein